MTERQRALADAMLEVEIIRFGEFRLKDGSISPVYIDLRRLISHPLVLRKVVDALKPMIGPLRFDRICTIFYAASPLLGPLILETGLPGVYVRKEKVEGKSQIEGLFEPGDVVVVIDDVVTTGASKLEAWEPLEAAGMLVRDVVVLVDRGQGGAAVMESYDKKLHAVLHLREVVDDFVERGKIAAELRDKVIAFLDANMHA